MKIDITRLKSGIDTLVEFSETHIFNSEELKKVDLLDLKDILVTGEITRNHLNEYQIDATLSGTMIIPCAITLIPVDYPFEVQLSGNILEMLEEMNEIDKKIENTIDILPIIWENILMEIPMRVVSEEAKNLPLEGDGWRLITDGLKEEVSPELQKLKDLLEEK